MTHKGQKLGKDTVGMTFLCFKLYHKHFVQDQPYSHAFQIPRANVHSHALKMVNSVSLPTTEFPSPPSLQESAKAD